MDAQDIKTRLMDRVCSNLKALAGDELELRACNPPDRGHDIAVRHCAGNRARLRDIRRNLMESLRADGWRCITPERMSGDIDGTRIDLQLDDPFGGSDRMLVRPVIYPALNSWRPSA